MQRTRLVVATALMAVCVLLMAFTGSAQAVQPTTPRADDQHGAAAARARTYRRAHPALPRSYGGGGGTVSAAEAIGGLRGPGFFRASSGSDSTSATGSSNTLAPTVTRTIDDGFDLGSAAIGAGSATVVLLLAGAGATAVSRRRRPIRTVG
jgi:hypothetical protein